jgi:hypothetical protein
VNSPGFQAGVKKLSFFIGVRINIIRRNLIHAPKITAFARLLPFDAIMFIAFPMIIRASKRNQFFIPRLESRGYSYVTLSG